MERRVRPRRMRVTSSATMQRSRWFVPQLFLVLVVGCALVACGDDDGGSADAAPVDAFVAIDAGAPDGSSAAACYPDGIYGICADTGCPNCLRGATVYEVCTSSCTEASDCGDPADFNGATPTCAPLNPGSTQMICVLICTSQDQCPCGLECRASGAGVDICATTL